VGHGIGAEFSAVPGYRSEVSLIGSGKYLFDRFGDTGAHLTKAIAAVYDHIKFACLRFLD